MQFDDIRYVVITSDEHHQPHMLRGPWAKRPLIRGDTERAAEFVTQYCDELNQHENVIHISGGDTIDTSDPQPDRVLWLKNYFEKHLSVCKHYLYIQGQHEKSSRCPHTPWLSVIDKRTIHIDRKTFYIGDQCFAAIDNTSPEELQSFIGELDEDIPYNLFTHQLWKPWVPMGVGNLDLMQLPANIRRVFSGDMHLKKDLLLPDGRQFFSVGPFFMQAWREETEPRFLVIDLRDNSVVYVPLPCRKVFQTTIRNEEELELQMAHLSQLPKYSDPADIDIALLKVSYNSRIPGLQQTLEEFGEGRFHLFADPYVQSEGEAFSFESIYGPGAQQLSNSVTEYLNKHEATGQGKLVRDIVDQVLISTNPKDLEAKLNQLRASQGV
jgi:hypothetical protein